MGLRSEPLGYPSNCPNCGAPVNGNKFCMYCGTQLRRTNEVEPLIHFVKDVYYDDELRMKVAVPDGVGMGTEMALVGKAAREYMLPRLVNLIECRRSVDPVSMEVIYDVRLPIRRR